MAKSNSKKENRRKRKILLALIMILFVGIVLTASTYAWFTANRTVSVQAIDVQVSTSQGLQISTDASSWKSIVTNADITGANWTGVKNQFPSNGNTAAPVSTVGTVDSNGLMEMYKGTIDTGTGGINILKAEKSTETNGTSGDFVAFDLFFQSSVAQTVYLTSNSSVLTKGATDTGIQNAARVAFIKEGSVAYGSVPSAAQELKGNVSSWIWEPNYDVHTAAGVNNALNVYNITVGQTGGSKLAYNGVKADIPKSSNTALNSTSDTYFDSVTTVGSVAAGIPTTAYLNAFAVAEGITKVRIYMWIEGQDVDCEDHASGGSLSYSLEFSIDNKAANSGT